MNNSGSIVKWLDDDRDELQLYITEQNKLSIRSISRSHKDEVWLNRSQIVDLVEFLEMYLETNEDEEMYLERIYRGTYE